LVKLQLPPSQSWSFEYPRGSYNPGTDEAPASSPTTAVFPASAQSRSFEYTGDRAEYFNYILNSQLD